jgi:HK97 family phage major capsid protein
MQDMPSVAANSLSLVYADFMRGYTIIDRTGLQVIRDDVTRKKNNIIELTFHRYNHGQVVLPEAFKLLKTKA